MDIQLYYKEKGTGEPVILLHGNGGDSGYFVHQFDWLAQFFRVIAVDTRGHGQSPRGTAPFTLSQFADDLRALMDRLSLPRATLLGFSDGGNIALTFAIRYPERVDKLIVNGANTTPDGLLFSFYAPTLVRYWAAGIKAKKDSAAAAKAELLRLMVKEPHIKEKELKGISAPTLVIAGSKDLIERRHTFYISQTIPHAKLAFVKGSHTVAQDNPIDFNRILAEFLEIDMEAYQRRLEAEE